MKDKKKKKKKHKRKAQEFIPYPVRPVYSQQSVVSSRQPGSTESSAENPATSNKQQATENMEVHKHPHHVMHKKKWAEYLLEFLMLFLAVFLGFLAENKREHIIERERENQYMASLANDLAADTNMLNTAIRLRLERIKAIDTVFIFFSSNTNVQEITGAFFKTLRRTTYDRRLARNTITINQLKNAGGMRLVRNRQVADSIAAYDFGFERQEYYNDYYLINQQLTFRYLEKIVEARGLLHLYVENATTGVVGNMPANISVKLTSADLNEYLNLLMQIKVFARQEIENCARLRDNAVNLMTSIKKEYHLQ
jgi:hypothetical protein